MRAHLRASGQQSGSERPDGEKSVVEGPALHSEFHGVPAVEILNQDDFTVVHKIIVIRSVTDDDVSRYSIDDNLKRSVDLSAEEVDGYDVSIASFSGENPRLCVKAGIKVLKDDSLGHRVTELLTVDLE